MSSGEGNLSSPSYTANVGTPLYMPIEQANSQGIYSEKVDVYAAGIILFEMIHKMHTLHERLDTVKRLKLTRELPKIVIA